MMTLTKKLRLEVARKAEFCLGGWERCYDIEVKANEHGGSISFYWPAGKHYGHMIDSASLQSLLMFLKDKGIVGASVQTMWVGFGLDDPRMRAFCSLGLPVATKAAAA